MAETTELEYAVGDLKPGESRQLQLRLKAVQPGTIANLITARADANLQQHRFSFNVISPQLDVTLAGPKRRYLIAKQRTSCRFPTPARCRPPGRTGGLSAAGPEIRQDEQRGML